MKNFLFTCCLISFFWAQAQPERCASWHYLQRQLTGDPVFNTQFEEQQRQLEQAVNQLSAQRDQAEIVYTIPVVVHVVYKDAIQNISDLQIQSQIDALNKDYRLLNSDKLSSSHPFYSVSADAQIEFCLAAKDPSNNPTTGIIRKTTDRDGFIDDDKVKHNGTGGDNAWDATKYLNIWVCKLNNGLLGYATFPGTTPSNDGVVIAYDCFGTTGTLDPTYNKGRTATHEIGHWLNLEHIWGDDGNTDGVCDTGECTGSDGVTDTPDQCDNTYGCPTGVVTDLCTTTPPGIMYMNYMDYTNDACMNMFTQGQVNRMRTALALERTTLLSSNKCGSVSAVNNQNIKVIGIYPNPVVNYLYLENLPQTRQNTFNLQLIDELGRVVIETEYKHAQQEVEVSDLLNGYYVVRVFNEEFIGSQKILVLH